MPVLRRRKHIEFLFTGAHSGAQEMAQYWAVCNLIPYIVTLPNRRVAAFGWKYGLGSRLGEASQAPHFLLELGSKVATMRNGVSSIFDQVAVSRISTRCWDRLAS